MPIFLEKDAVWPALVAKIAEISDEGRCGKYIAKSLDVSL